MTVNASRSVPNSLLVLMLAYGLASLIHFVHNAEFLAVYPNMPSWITPSGVYAVWLGVTAVGVAGFLLYRFGWPLAGLLAIAVYAVLGFAGLDHYMLAPVLAHTAAMNFTIWLEVAAAAVLLAATLKRAWALR